SGGRCVHRGSPADRGAAGEEGIVMSPSLRRGLPRISGGEAWPPEGTPAPPTEFVPQSSQATAPSTDTAVAAATAAVKTAPEPASPAPAGASAPAPTPAGETFRRGLPRVAGGEPWPPADAAPAGIAAAASAPAATDAAP